MILLLFVIHYSHWLGFEVLIFVTGNNADRLLNERIGTSHHIFKGRDFINVINRGRYISIEREETDVLHLCEVYVFKFTLGK